jgi:predicted ATPase
MENKLVRLTLKGFKSIENIDLDFEHHQLNVLIGANGAGNQISLHSFVCLVS